MTKFSWEPLAGGSLLLRVTDGDRTTTWKLTKSTKPLRVAAMMAEISGALMTEEPKFDYFRKAEPMTDITLDGVPITLEEISPKDTITEAMSRAAQADRVAGLHANGGKWWSEDVNDLELKTLGSGDTEGNE